MQLHMILVTQVLDESFLSLSDPMPPLRKNNVSLPFSNPEVKFINYIHACTILATMNAQDVIYKRTKS